VTRLKTNDVVALNRGYVYYGEDDGKIKDRLIYGDIGLVGLITRQLVLIMVDGICWVGVTHRNAKKLAQKIGEL
jgi:hypothetical protein